MLSLGTHKIYKITSLTTDSYKPLFVLITMLLTVLSVQQSSAAVIPLAAATAKAASLQQLATAITQRHNLQQHHPPPDHPLNVPYHHRHNYRHHHRRLQQHLNQQHPPQPHPEIHLNLLLDTNGDHDDYGHLLGQSETDIDNVERLLHKRHMDFATYYRKTMNSDNIEWYNPCGGHHVDVNKKPKAKSKPPIKKILRTLKNATVRVYNSLNVHELNAIVIRNMSMWDAHAQGYEFLPILNESVKSLRRWHREMQYYVAAFYYLHRAQLYWDYNKNMKESQTSHELYLLRNNAREILCNIENAINITNNYSKVNTIIDKLFIPRERMESHLSSFKEEIQLVSPLYWNPSQPFDESYVMNDINLRFAKSRYLKYIRKFIRFLRNITKQKGPIHLHGMHKKEANNKKLPKDPVKINEQNKERKNMKRRKSSLE
ncbi:uncharacterized protein LOC142230447 [Haematobia irritans]|uniref:uncharacterized protein LOC142230447 n=1 Tax=Haematobia irritans TaxID=7368 RepID=UPI003F50458F